MRGPIRTLDGRVGVVNGGRMDTTSPGPSADVTALLRRWSSGDEDALHRLIPLVYDQLRAVAHRRLRSESPGHTLQTTALVHEAYVRLAGAELSFRDRSHFFALAARTMRRVLVDASRARLAVKRGGGAEVVPLGPAALVLADGTDAEEVLELHDALERLEAQDPRKAKIIEAHVFAGMTRDEIAEAVGVSTPTVDRDLRMARAWLARELA
jgi:RNA polymerase sigma-70 factor (ECF subfamily)